LLAVATTPVPCRFLPLRANKETIRIGDAQASFDPIAGRGLWHAIRGAEEVAIAIDEDPERLVSIGRQAADAYRQYLAIRGDFYRAGCERFRTAFW
jgi:2-polyprenyl-6-methoxyphenol hydroxylase-like FAD-dependent oxidoreductase